MSTPGGSRKRDERPVPAAAQDGRRTDPGTADSLPLPAGGVGGPPAAGAEKVTAEVTEPMDGDAVGPDAAGDATAREGADAGERLEECVADLRRLKAEYDNYRKRVQRDRASLQQIAVANVLRGLLPALDAVTEARRHGEVTGGFQGVVAALEEQLTALGLQEFGDPGEPFDPERHEALTHVHSDEVDRPTCVEVLRRGYRVGSHLLRPAQVAVAEPA